MVRSSPSFIPEIEFLTKTKCKTFSCYQLRYTVSTSVSVIVFPIAKFPSKAYMFLNFHKIREQCMRTFFFFLIISRRKHNFSLYEPISFIMEIPTVEKHKIVIGLIFQKEFMKRKKKERKVAGIVQMEM